MVVLIKTLLMICLCGMAIGLVIESSYALLRLLWELSYEWRMRRRNKTRNKEV